MFAFSWASTLRPGRDRYFMPATDTASWGPMLKDTYHDDAILNSLQDQNRMQEWMSEVKAQPTQGNKHIIPIMSGRNYSVGSIGTGALPPDGRIKTKRWEVDMRDVYLRVGFDKQVMQRSRNDKGAFAEASALEMTAGVDSAAFFRNRMAWYTGTGILAKVSGVHASASTIEVKDSGGVTGTTRPNRFIHGDSEDGMFVTFRDGGSPTTIKGYGKVTGVNSDLTDFTIDTPQTLADGDFVITAQHPTQDSYNDEPEGILAGVDDGTYVAQYHALNRSTVDVARASVITGVGNLSLDAIQMLFDTQGIRVGDGADTLASGDGVARAYLALLEMDRRYTGADLKSPDGGTKRAKKPFGKGSITYGDVPWLIERDAPFGMLFGLLRKSWIRLKWPDSGWAEEGGIIKWVPEYDKFTAYWHLFENYHCMQPARNFRAEGITTTELAVRTL